MVQLGDNQMDRERAQPGQANITYLAICLPEDLRNVMAQFELIKLELSKNNNISL